MVGISTASAPLLTRYLATERNVFRDEPLVFVDLGARGGFNTEWKTFGDHVRIYAFEADEQECARLNAEAAPGVTYLPWAIGRHSGPATLYEAKLGASTGLYHTNMGYFGRLLNRDNGVVTGERQISLRTLHDALTECGVETFDFIKLDVEGAELDVLLGSEAYLKRAEPLGVLSEIRFQPEINGSQTFAALDSFLQPLGLRLYGLDYSQQSRAALPYPGIQDYRLPSGERFFAYTTHGQVQDGNALYFRDLLLPANKGTFSRISAIRILKLVALYEIYNLSDCAAELIVETRHLLAPIVDCDRLLDLLASEISDRETSYANYIATYFSSPPEMSVQRQPAEITDSPTIAQLQESLAAIYNSASWRITKPLRFLKRIISPRK